MNGKANIVLTPENNPLPTMRVALVSAGDKLKHTFVQT